MEIRKRTRQDKKQFINNKCNTIETLNELGRDGEMFKEIKALIREFTPSVKIINDKNGNTLTGNEDILNRWKEYCSKMYMDKDTNQNEIELDACEKEPEPAFNIRSRACHQIFKRRKITWV